MIVLSVIGVYFGYAAIRFLLRPRSFTWPTPGVPLLVTLGTVLLVLYLAAGWSSTGRTVGKQLMGLRVVNLRGDRMRFVGAFGRSLLCVVFPIGLFWAAVSRENRSVQDLILRTSVVYDWQLRVPPHERSAGPTASRSSV